MSALGATESATSLHYTRHDSAVRCSDLECYRPLCYENIISPVPAISCLSVYRNMPIVQSCKVLSAEKFLDVCINKDGEDKVPLNVVISFMDSNVNHKSNHLQGCGRGGYNVWSLDRGKTNRWEDELTRGVPQAHHLTGDKAPTSCSDGIGYEEDIQNSRERRAIIKSKHLVYLTTFTEGRGGLGTFPLIPTASLPTTGSGTSHSGEFSAVLVLLRRPEDVYSKTLIKLCKPSSPCNFLTFSVARKIFRVQIHLETFMSVMVMRDFNLIHRPE
ncbi:hypothetical protein J6590_031670 [Homalodisca vitripennis]|nr:hypothetical protein J6590_031670 [Homalodisca vitripennis]